MSRYLLDTNVISETARPKPGAGVIRWLGQLSVLPKPLRARPGFDFDDIEGLLEKLEAL